MQHTTTQITTADGSCPAHVFHPDGAGPWPAVLLFMDGIGMRSAIVDMAARLASAGYYVLAPDLFYRVGYRGEYGVSLFSNPDARADWMARIMPSASPANVVRDTEAFLAHFADAPQASDDKVGITGYCMGGRLAVYMAGHFGDRFAAAASYHGGGLATDAPDSPHRLAPQMKARVYVAGAKEDSGFDDAQKARLEEALTAAGVVHTVETYNAHHGWVPSDTPVHDVVETEHHWDSLLTLFAQSLGGSHGVGISH